MLNATVFLAANPPSRGDWLKLIVVLFFLVWTGFMAASEMALTRLSLVRALALEDEKRRGAKRIVRMVRDPAPYLNTLLLLTLVGTTAASILSATVAENIFGNIGLTIATIGATLLLFIFSEVIPKTYTLQNPERVAFVTLPVVYFLTRVLSPLSGALIWISNVIAPGKGLKKGPLASEAEIRHMVELAGSESAIEDEERQMIHSVFEFNDTVVREVMVPRPDMVTVEMSATLTEVLDVVVKHGYSRIPAYRGELDHIEGIVYAKDLLARVREGKLNGTAADVVRPAVFVPETKRISELLKEMQQKKFHMAIVFDEYGGVAGLVTLEDLIEEIVGEIVDEYDTEEPQVVELDERTLRVHGRVPIDEVNEKLHTELPEGEWDTVAGLVVGLLGRVPEPNEEVHCDGAVFVVERVEGHRVLSVRVTKITDESADDEEAARVES